MQTIVDWKKRVPKEEVVKCEKCKVDIWIYWYQGSRPWETQIKGGMRTMSLCGPCYFKKK